jgi:2'-5' RNA ligase
MSILSVFVCVETWEENTRRLPAAQTKLAELLAGQTAFDLEFRGVTASPAAVMIQGFPLDNSLQALRQRVRDGFETMGLIGEMDRRYPPVTAHLTVMRFRKQLADREAFRQFVEANRTREFGRARIRSLQLVWNDWYMSEAEVRVMAKYPLA